jgi:arylsulfatase A-like enzyme
MSRSSRQALVLGVLLAASTAGAQKPNIVYILADDLGFGDLGSYGQRKIQTPHLDALAGQGVRFTHHYAHSVCAPSRYGLMMGREPGHSAVRANNPNPGIRQGETSVAAFLKAQGYRTGVIGKWGLGTVTGPGFPTRAGFDFFYGYLGHADAHQYFPTELWRNDALENVAPGTYSHNLFVKEALDFVGRSPGTPFFLYLAFTIPHTGVGEMQVPNLQPYQDKPWPEPERRKAAMIDRLDKGVGQVLERLRTLGLDNNTIVLFASDNGPHTEGGVDPTFFNSNGPLRGIKRDLYEGGVRTPLLARWPGHIGAGRVVHDRYGNWDFYRTVADLLQTAPPAEVEGVSMMPALLGTSSVGDRPIYFESFERDFRQFYVEGDWKAIRYARDVPVKLFNLQSDPGEKTNVALRHPKVATDLTGKMKQSRVNTPDYQAPSAGQIILQAVDAEVVAGGWRLEDDATAANGRKLVLPNLGRIAAHVQASPQHYVEFTFEAHANKPYHFWIRGRAQGNSIHNDAVSVQFSGSLDSEGKPKHRIGSTSAALVSFEDCSGCGLSGWGWVDQVRAELAPPMYFEGGKQRMRIQMREDGTELDQILLSPSDYFFGPPGETKDDSTILPGGG